VWSCLYSHGSRLAKSSWAAGKRPSTACSDFPHSVREVEGSFYDVARKRASHLLAPNLPTQRTRTNPKGVRPSRLETY
jgi:hypothetical protein